MSKTVSNDALWEKLSEISEQLNRSKQTENILDFNGVKDEIFAEMERQTTKLGKHYDLNFKANEDNWRVTDENITKIFDIVSRIRKQQRETSERQSESDTEQRLEALEAQTNDNREYFNFRFFKLRKTYVVITMLGLLVLILTLFCMKQQNDYALLNGKYYKQSAVIREMQVEVDSLRNTLINQNRKKK